MNRNLNVKLNEKWFGNRILPRDAYRLDGVYDFKVRKLFTTCCEVIDESTDITASMRNEPDYHIRFRHCKCL